MLCDEFFITGWWEYKLYTEVEGIASISSDAFKHPYIPQIANLMGANMGPTWVLSDPDGPHVGAMNLAIRDYMYTICLDLVWCRDDIRFNDFEWCICLYSSEQLHWTRGNPTRGNGVSLKGPVDT